MDQAGGPETPAGPDMALRSACHRSFRTFAAIAGSIRSAIDKPKRTAYIETLHLKLSNPL